VLPKKFENWSLTSLEQRLVKTGGRLVKHARYSWLLLGREPSHPAAVLEHGPADRCAGGGDLVAEGDDTSKNQADHGREAERCFEMAEKMQLPDFWFFGLSEISLRRRQETEFCRKSSTTIHFWRMKRWQAVMNSPETGSQNGNLR